MDCCGNTRYEDEKENMKGGKSMVEINKKTLLWVIIFLLLIATIFLTVKASSIGPGAAQAAASTAKTIASTTSSGMVGGC